MGYGLLEEMSIVELRERITEIKEARRKEEETRREERKGGVKNAMNIYRPVFKNPVFSFFLTINSTD